MAAVFARAGLATPDDAGYTRFDLSSSSSVRQLERLGVECKGPALQNGNVVFLRDASPTGRRLRIEFLNGRDNRFYLGEEDRLRGVMLIGGSNNVLINEGRPSTPRAVILNVRFNGAQNLVFVGRGTTSNGATLVASGPRTFIRIGRDCMFSNGIWVRASDMHAVVDLKDRSIVNPPEDVTLGDHVWIGQEALVLKGLHVGSGSVIAARALVNASCPGYSLVAGVPARVIREGIAWTRQPKPTSDHIDLALRLSEGEDVESAGSAA